MDTITTYAVIAAIIGFITGVIISALFLLHRHAAIKARLEENLERRQTLEEEIVITQSSLRAERESAIRFQAERESFKQQAEAQKLTIKEIEIALLGKFENLSNKITAERNNEFKAQSQETLGLLLNPLKEKLADFQTLVNHSFGEQAKEQRSLKDQIESIVAATQKVQLQAEGLTKALKGDSKVQGKWGEVILENILEASGLQKGRDYSLQGKGMGMRHVEDGTIQKPDFIVNLPEGKHIIIDSKVSLTDYERFCSEQDEMLRGGHLSQFLASVRKHVKDLEDRRYQDTDGLGTPDVVLMFMPIEAAYVLANQADPQLMQFAWDKKVVIVCSSTLFGILKTIHGLWVLVFQNQNTQKIAREGGALYDKIEGFTKDMLNLGKQLKTVEGTFESAMNKLSTGRGSILSKTENLKRLGAKASKSLPQNLIAVDGDNGEEQEQAENINNAA